MIFLRQSTAATVLIGPFIDDTDGKTAETGLTVSQADIRLSKNGGNMAQKNESTSCTHDELGYYTCPLDTTDTGTLGNLKLMVHETGALPVFHDFQVVTANVFDTLFSTDVLNVELNAAGLDTAVVEGSVTAVQVLRLIAGVLGGKSSGGGTTTLTYRNLGDTADRVIFTVDASNNRTTVSRTLT